MFYLYAKMMERLDVFDDVLDAVSPSSADLRVFSEHARAWYRLDDLIRSMAVDDVLCVPSISDLGDVSDDRILRVKSVMVRQGLVVVCDVFATYEFGINRVLNHAVLNAVMQGMSSGSGGFAARPSVGRPRIDFPDGWDELYDSWERGEITSKEFLSSSGLKKATFYNKLADYRDLRTFNLGYMSRVLGCG